MIRGTSVNQHPLFELASEGEWACLGPAGLSLWPWSETDFAVEASGGSWLSGKRLVPESPAHESDLCA